MKILTEQEAENFLEKRKFPVARRLTAKTKEQALAAAKKLGFPLTLKIISKKILHKSIVNGVKLNINSNEDVEKAFDELKKIRNFEAALVQKFIPGEYVLIGLKKDPTFGHVIAFGLGGIFTEVIKDVSFRVCPITKKDAEEMMHEIKGYAILKSDHEKFNINAIKNILLKISALAQKNPKKKELDINPVVVNEKKATIVDARIIFE